MSIYQNKGVHLKWFIPAIVWGITILVLSTAAGIKLPRIPGDVIATDKLAHASVYLIFCTLLTFGFRRSNSSFSRAALTSVLLSSGYGILMEVLQYTFFPYRHFEVWDIVANIIGSLLGVLVSYFFIK